MADLKNPSVVLEQTIKALERERDDSIERIKSATLSAIAAANDAITTLGEMPSIVARTLTDATMVLTGAFEEQKGYDYRPPRSALSGHIRLCWDGGQDIVLRERPNNSGAWKLEEESKLPAGKYRVILIVLAVHE